MLWGWFAASGSGNLVQVDGIVNKEDYVAILKNNAKTSVASLALDRHSKTMTRSINRSLQTFEEHQN